MKLNDLYEKCKNDKETYKDTFKSKYKSGGEPFKYTEELKKILEEHVLGQNTKILEIGTGFGYTTGLFLFALKNKVENTIDTFEERDDHSRLAKVNLTRFCEDNSLDLSVVNFYNTDFVNYFKNTGEVKDKYDIIFFDGYSPQFEYLEIYKKLLKKGGLLISANSHLGKADPKYFTELRESGQWTKIEEFGDTIVLKFS